LFIYNDKNKQFDRRFDGQYKYHRIGSNDRVMCYTTSLLKG